jgi:hypothetical protein
MGKPVHNRSREKDLRQPNKCGQTTILDRKCKIHTSLSLSTLQVPQKNPLRDTWAFSF